MNRTILALSALLVPASLAQSPPPANYDESKAGSYILPDPLVLASGKRVRNATMWREQRRPEILRLFEENMHGHSPPRPPGMTFDVFDKGTAVRDGKAIRKQITIHFTADKSGPRMDLLLYVPAHSPKPVPVLLHLSFTANSLTVDDPGVKEGLIWNREKKLVPASQGRGFGKLRVDDFIARGFGIATVYYGDIEPDFAGGFPHGVRGLFLKPGQTEPGPGDWGAIGAWAWGLSRAMDYLETDKNVDAKRVAIAGVSRLGKTVLWAGAEDQRFAMVIASCSGEGGAALSRRNYGETIKNLNTRFSYQFAGNYQKFGDHPDSLPVDAHMLLALIAPRPLLLSTGDQDRWSDPRGEFLAAVAAGPVYRLLGKQDLGTDQFPPAGQPILHTLGYSMHAGGHGAIPSDWDVFLQFMEKYLR
ncbi:MAG: acetylxylan esterase [Bryobacterales bacterium]|nr:acetylxylan esterase [Bryobacterales bacterium]